MRRLVFGACMALGVLTAWADFELTGSTPLPVIVIPAAAAASTELAAQELSAYIAKASGVALSTARAPSTAPRQIVLGTVATLPESPAAIRERLTKAADDAFFIQISDERLLIVGKDGVAELYGVYYFLQHYLGVRWLAPATADDDGEHVPKQSKISLPAGELFRQPHFAVRRLDQVGSAWNAIPKHGVTWAVRNGYQIATPYSIPVSNPALTEFYTPRLPPYLTSSAGGHTTFSAAVPAKEYFDEHPEYFTFLDGKRVLFDGGHKGVYQYCISNPEVQKLVVEKICQQIAEHGVEKATYCFGMTDTSVGWCECDACRALDPPGPYHYLNISTRFHKVVQAMSAQVYARYPKARLSTWAYHTYRENPDGVQHDPRIRVYYCIHGRCYGHRLDDPSCRRNRQQLELLNKWRERSSDVYLYEYSTCTPTLYVPNERVQAQEIRLYRDWGLTGTKFEALYADSHFVGAKNPSRKDIFPSNWQWLYVTGQLLWDPDLDVDAMLSEIEGLYYGAAGPAMSKYHGLRRRLWENTPHCMGYPTGDQRRPNLLNQPGSREELLRYLAEAETLAAGDAKVMARLARDRRYLEDYWIAPNDEMRAKASQTLMAPTTSEKVTIDGDGSDKAWVGAFYTSDFRESFTPEKAVIPERLQTTVGMLSDAENLYFLVTAMEPNPAGIVTKATEKDGTVWSDDAIECFLYPPSADNSYYQIVVNPRGVVFDAINPGADASFDSGVEAKARILPDRYVIEMRVPAARLAPFRRGEIWRVHFARNRRQEDAAKNFSLDAVAYHDTSSYRSLAIGSPYLANGSFDDLDENGKPVKWTVSKAEVRGEGPNKALEIAAYGHAYQLLTDRDLWQSPQPRPIVVTFRASGQGKLNLSVLRYTDTPDAKAKHGYQRAVHPTLRLASFDLAEEPALFTASYMIPAGEWAGIMFSTDKKAILDDVAVTLE
ncbi:MAG: DUF4838 domain-containing protein [Lentisphaerae bacterium]|nr:DUF4838 domain-containing protein [Lentisphaerota bacterium]